MLTALSIRDVVLIETLELDFGAGLGVLTGETGAGKSILLDALGLALGMRADSGLVRSGQAQASVSVSFEIGRDHAALALIEANGLAHEPGELLVIRRTVKADGGSRAFVDDQPVSAGLLRELGATLVEIHGQHDDRGLLNPRGHRGLLDSFGRIGGAPAAAAWARVQDAEARLAAARAAHDEAMRDRDWLAHAAGELDALAPRPGEEEALASLRAGMQAGARLGDELETVSGLLQGSDGGLALLRQAARRLDRIAAEHAMLAECLAALDRAVIEAAEAEDALVRARGALAFDPARLEEAEARLFEIRALARKHRVEADALPALAEDLRVRLGAIAAGGAEIAALETELTDARAIYGREAAILTAARQAAAARLDAAVAGELAPLKLDQARFRTVIGAAEPGPGGGDRVEFEVSTNAGAPFGPLVRIASGGELSRFILALKVALAEEGGATTMIFDEIDRGVGGAVASAVGERLHRLAEAGQVLVVTHSPQVAARGAMHLLIEKSHDGVVTRTGVHLLDEARRREEIARMLSGAQVTDEARAQAVRLLEAA
jgi:DNA repair protein RecN (Recombination protein N)